MKKPFSVAVSVVLALTILLSMTGCCCSLGSSESLTSQRVEYPQNNDQQDETPGLEFPKEESVSIVGTWETTIDCGAVVEAALSSNERYTAMGSNFFNGLEIESAVTFYADGTMVSKVDEVSAREFAEEFVVALLKVSIESIGLNMSVEEYLESNGTSLEEVIDEMYGSDAMTKMFEELQQEGTYRVDGNKLYLIRKGEEFDENKYMPFTLTADTLVMEAPVGQDYGADVDQEIVETAKNALYPMTYTKVR